MNYLSGMKYRGGGGSNDVLSDARIVANRRLESTMVFHDDTDDDTDDNKIDDTDDDAEPI